MWSPRFVPGIAPDGAPILSVLAKASYQITPEGLVALEQPEEIPFFEQDEYYGKMNPDLDAVKHESDLVAYKPMTDIVIHGEACAPAGKRAKFFDMGVSVAGLIHRIRVTGNRVLDCSNGKIRFSEPESFERMPLHFGLAYGGTDKFSDPEQPYSYPRNPVGKGFLVNPDPTSVHGLELPNLEDPSKLLDPGNLLIQKWDRWMEAPVPRALGYTSRHSYPRYLMMGQTPDQALETNMAIQAGKGGDVPPILNHQYFNGAPTGMRFPYLWGGETILLAYVDPENPQWSFQLPKQRPIVYLDLGRGTQGAETVLHTVEIFPKEKKLTMVWRGSLYYAGLDSLKACADCKFWAESMEAIYAR